jgi:hypothetical protein
MVNLWRPRVWFALSGRCGLGGAGPRGGDSLCPGLPCRAPWGRGMVLGPLGTGYDVGNFGTDCECLGPLVLLRGIRLAVSEASFNRSGQRPARR